MKKEFWLERWERAEIGFHQNEVHPYLLQFWPTLKRAQGGQEGGEIFVPLCGKSLDMLWLRQQGQKVLGVELSPIAVRDFFIENGMALRHSSTGQFDCCEADDIRILCGDFFELEKAHLAGIGAVYDRASLIALPPEMRERYARHLVSILPPATQIFLITLDYPQDEMQGPPFAVSLPEVEALYGKHAEIRVLAREDVLALNPRFRERGVNRLQERVILLTLR